MHYMAEKNKKSFKSLRYLFGNLTPYLLQQKFGTHEDGSATYRSIQRHITASIVPKTSTETKVCHQQSVVARDGVFVRD